MPLLDLYESKEAKSPSFFFKKSSCSIVSNDLILEIEELCKKEKKVVRVCLHENSEADLHNMIIAHPKGWYVRPHVNIFKSKSYHLIRGKMLMIGFDKEKKELFRFILSKENPICRLSCGVYLFLWPFSEICIFEEVTIGPFRRDVDAQFAKWAPEDIMDKKFDNFISDLIRNN